MKSSLEHGEQVAFVNWFRATYPDVLIFAIPNGGKRGKGEAKRLKDEGVVAGIPDLYVPAWKLWVEMKREDGGRLSDEQAGMLDYLQTIGDTVAVCHGWKEARDTVCQLVLTQCAQAGEYAGPVGRK